MLKKFRMLALLCGVALVTQAETCTPGEIAVGIGAAAIGLEVIREVGNIIEPGVFGSEPTVTGTPSMPMQYPTMRNDTPNVPGYSPVAKNSDSCVQLRGMIEECRRRHAAIGGGTEGQAGQFLACVKRYEDIYYGHKCG